MRNFIKENWFKIIVILIIIAGICFYYFGYYLIEKRQIVSVDLQEKCSSQAQKIFSAFKEKYTNDGWNSAGSEPASTRDDFNQENHYNQKLNKCYTLIKYEDTNDGNYYANSPNTLDYTLPRGESLIDAYENNELASCLHGTDGRGQQEDICLIGAQNGTIKYNEYLNFVNQRMERNTSIDSSY